MISVDLIGKFSQLCDEELYDFEIRTSVSPLVLL